MEMDWANELPKTKKDKNIQSAVFEICFFIFFYFMIITYRVVLIIVFWRLNMIIVIVPFQSIMMWNITFYILAKTK